MDAFLHNLICCPDCNSDLLYRGTILECTDCGIVFPLEDGIPLLFSRKVLQDHLYQGYQDQYNKIAEDLHEVYLKETRYMEMGYLEKLSYHIFQWPSALRQWKSVGKIHKRMETMRRFIGPTSDLTILDVGAGEARLLSFLGGKKVAFDISPYHLKYTKGEGLARVAGFAERLPFKDKVFDLVISAAVLEHVLRAEDIAGEMTRVTKPSGRIIVETPFNEAPERLHQLREDYKTPVVEKPSAQRKERRRPPTLRLRNFENIEDLAALFPNLQANRINFYAYKRKRSLPRWLKMFLRPMRWMPDSFKQSLPTLFIPTMVQVELISTKQPKKS